MLSRLIAVASVLVTATASNAQTTDSPGRGGGEAFALEALGGTLGSMVGTGLGVIVSGIGDCPVDDDVVCPFKRLGVPVVGSLVGATGGAVLLGRSTDTDPSVLGATIGSIVGLAAGVGALHLVQEVFDRRLPRFGALVVFSVSQGVVTALGSRTGS